MKKIIAILMIAVMVTSIAACGKDPDVAKSDTTNAVVEGNEPVSSADGNVTEPPANHNENADVYTVDIEFAELNKIFYDVEIELPKGVFDQIYDSVHGYEYRGTEMIYITGGWAMYDGNGYNLENLLYCHSGKSGEYFDRDGKPVVEYECVEEVIDEVYAEYYVTFVYKFESGLTFEYRKRGTMAGTIFNGRPNGYFYYYEGEKISREEFEEKATLLELYIMEDCLNDMY